MWSQVNQDKMQIFQSKCDSITRSSRFAAACFCPGVIFAHSVDLRLPVASECKDRYVGHGDRGVQRVPLSRTLEIERWDAACFANE